MRGKDLLECMEYIDDELVQEALEPVAVKNNMFVKWSIAAACVVVIGISSTAFWAHQNIRNEQLENTSENNAAAPMDTAGKPSENGQTTNAVTEDTSADTGGREADQYAGQGIDGTVGQESMAYAEEIKDLTEEESTKLAYTIIDSYYSEEDASVYDYPIPDKGEYLCYQELQETMEYYAAKEDPASAINTTNEAANSIYVYEIVIDIYGDVEIEGCRGIHYENLSTLDNSSAANVMIEQEYRRLIELGYAVRLSEDFQLTGTFTKVELDTFQASPEYGYVFRFASEG